ncbi:MAG: hypothetical protein FJ197_10620 [Gammaproteobacteria bacterium]|nr:hypothetical protein [Gammaproteobacteria bacterium]
MRLPRPFYQLPVRFDVGRLRAEVGALPADAWAAHPNGIAGNSSLRLISVDGGENDGVTGRMSATPHLVASPYIRQVLESFGVVWSRSRLMRLAAGATVPLHADINYHWFTRARIHIPVVTNPAVKFHCGAETVHMAAGEAWVFDNWRPHHVENGGAEERIHLVADTSGSSAFWRFVAQSGLPASAWREHRWDPAREARPLTEDNVPPPVMAPAEAEWLLGDLARELIAVDEGAGGEQAIARYRQLLEEFCQDWRQLVALHGVAASAGAAYERIIDALRSRSRELAAGLVMRTNRVEAHRVLEGRVLRHLVSQPATRDPLDSPVFIVAAPRSGSTLLFETLAAHGGVATPGGEAHWLVESLPELRPGAPGIDSNRLSAAAVTPQIAAAIRTRLAERLVDALGQPLGSRQPLLVLEKTPKNALRIPFFRRVFPRARFLFLWREPAENIASIIEAWRDGGWVTYPELPGWDGPWSLLLPPQWQLQRGQSPEAIAAWQWDSTNRIVCDDLAELPASDWTAVAYHDLVRDPAATVARLVAFLGLPDDAALAARLALPLPLSRYTQSPPAPDKWRRHEAALAPLLPALEPTRRRLRALA